MKRKVILVTDGDLVAQKAVETAAHNVGGRCISASGGNPTPKTGKELVDLIKSAVHDPVVVMVDDRGRIGEGKGESALKTIFNDPDMEVIGVVAVASNTPGEQGVKVDYSIDQNHEVISNPVDKYGKESEKGDLSGDTVGILRDLPVPVVIGIGDPGKMDFHDRVEDGAPITTKALQEILKRSGM